MKASIEDEVALRSLSAVNARGYLISRGWKDAGRYGANASILSIVDHSGREWQTLLPVREQVADYAERMAELLHVVASVESRSQLSVFNDLMLSGFDVVRLRAPIADAQGTIGLNHGVALFAEAQNLLTAVAQSTLRPRTVHRGKSMSQAAEYLGSLRLGQTEAGSYVLKVLSPVGPALQRDQLSLGPEYDEDSFPRAVTRKLDQSLYAVKQAIIDATATDRLDPFVSAVGQGVSANLCEAISRMADHARGIEISVGWARVRPAPAPVRNHLFSVDNARMLGEVAKEFRKNSPLLDETILGFVVKLAKDPDMFDGTVTIRALFPDGHRKLFATFPKEQYQILAQAHTDEVPVRVDGDIYRIPRGFELRNPRNLNVVNDNDPDFGAAAE